MATFLFLFLQLTLFCTVYLSGVRNHNEVLTRGSDSSKDLRSKIARSKTARNRKPKNSRRVKTYKPIVYHDGYRPAGFNKTIYLLWFTGFDNAPAIVKACHKSWADYNPTWTIVRLDNQTLLNYIPPVTLKQAIPNQATMNPAHVADIIRLMLLEKYGGIWADATTFCNRPLDDWLYSNITNGFFAFSRPSVNLTLSNWFLYGSKNSYLVRVWRKATMEYHALNPNTTRYFIQHELFEHLVETDPMFRSIWSSVPFVSGDIKGPHFIQQYGFYRKVSDKVRNHVMSKQTPLYKLSWKFYDEANFTGRSTLEYLFTTINISDLVTWKTTYTGKF